MTKLIKIKNEYYFKKKVGPRKDYEIKIPYETQFLIEKISRTFTLQFAFYMQITVIQI